MTVSPTFTPRSTPVPTAAPLLRITQLPTNTPTSATLHPIITSGKFDNYDFSLDGGDKNFKSLLARTDGVAQYDLGVCYSTLSSCGVAQDYEKAVYWWTKAAEQGIAQAQHRLGLSYANGNGVAQDWEKAIYWYTKVTEQNLGPARLDVSSRARSDLAWAQYNLGLSYANGDGVAQDFEKAIYWWTKAAEQGSRAAQTALNSLK